MATIEPLQALHYNLQRTGGLQHVVAPPYDVIDADQRTALTAQSPYNVVEIDLPSADDGDPYDHAAATLRRWRESGVVVRDQAPSLWPLEQDYVGPDGRPRTRRGILARVRIEPYGAGRIRPHERTHPGPREDRLRLTRATRANLSPIFSLFSDPSGAAWSAIILATADHPWGETTDGDGTVNRVWRVTDAAVIKAVQQAASGAELLIADGHHRYETARVYADEVGGDGDHRYVLMCLVALEDPGLTVFPTHRLIRGLRQAQREALGEAIRRDFEIDELAGTDELQPVPGERVRIGYIDSDSRRPCMLTLKDPAIADAALPDHAEPYRRLDTAVLEALILKGALRMTDDDIDHLNGLGYARSHDEALAEVTSGVYDAGFFMGATPVRTIQEVAEAGETMPPKSTYFYPKVPTGLVFNPLT